MRLKTFLWYLARPNFYPYMLEELARKLRSKKNIGTRDQARLWCRENSTSRDEVARWIGVDLRYKLDAATIEEADKVAKKIPIEMGGRADIDFIYACIMSRNPKNLLESGVSMGYSTLAILMAMNIKKAENGGFYKLVSVDMPYPRRNNEKYVAACVPDHLKRNSEWTLIREPDRNGLESALKHLQQIDFYSYDSDKSYWGRHFAIKTVLPKINPDSIIIMDDIDDNFGFRDICANLALEKRLYEFGGHYVGVIKL